MTMLVCPSAVEPATSQLSAAASPQDAAARPARSSVAASWICAPATSGGEPAVVGVATVRTEGASSGPAASESGVTRRVSAVGPSVPYVVIGLLKAVAAVAAPASEARARRGPGHTRCWSAGTGFTVETGTGAENDGRGSTVAPAMARPATAIPTTPLTTRMLTVAIPLRSATGVSFRLSAWADDRLVQPL